MLKLQHKSIYALPPLLHLLFVLLTRNVEARWISHFHFFFLTFWTLYTATRLLRQRLCGSSRIIAAILFSTAFFIVLQQTLLIMGIFNFMLLAVCADIILVLCNWFPIPFLPANWMQHSAEEKFDIRVLMFLLFVLLLRLITYNDPPMYHDGLTYHLSFAVEWMQKQNLLTPFQAYGDPAPTFYPMNSSLLYLWSITLSKSDFWARFTQIPYLILIVLAVLALVRRAGGGAKAVVFAILMLGLIRMLRFTHRDQGNDIIMTAFILAAVYYLSILSERFDKLAAFGFQLAIGLAVGVKYIALIYAGPLVIFFFVFLFHRLRVFKPLFFQALAFVVVIIMLGSFAYIRNIIATGSALFPAGIDNLPGFAARESGFQLYEHPFRHGCANLREVFGVLGYIPVILTPGTFGIFLVRVFRKELIPVELLLLSLSIVAMALFYFLFPYRHCRFLLFPQILLIPVAAIYLERFLRNRLNFSADLQSIFERAKYPLVVGTFILFGILLMRIHDYERSKYERWASKKVAGMRYGEGWKFVNDVSKKGSKGVRIAMTATQNMPYPLYGEKFRNEPFFVPKIGSRIVLSYSSKSTDFFPFRNVTEKEFVQSIIDLKADYLFSTISMHEKRFGVEDVWANGHRDMFQQVYAGSEVRIYKIKGSID